MEVLSKLNTTKKPKGHVIDAALTGQDDVALRAIFDDVDEHLGKLQQHRWHSKKTQESQDLHLRQYRAWMSAYLQRRGDSSIQPNDGGSDCNDHNLFSSDEATMIKNLNTCVLHGPRYSMKHSDIGSRYLLIVAKQMKASDEEQASIVALIQRRASILFWLERINSTPPDHDRLCKSTKGTLLYALKSLGFEQVSHGSDIKYFGKLEVMDLIDYDMKHSKTLEVAEQQHLAWVLSWVCGLRPSSLGDGQFCWVYSSSLSQT